MISQEKPKCKKEIKSRWWSDECVAECMPGWQQFNSYLPELCIKTKCPDTHEVCAGFLCIPKKDDTNHGNCAQAVIDVIEGNGPMSTGNSQLEFMDGENEDANPFRYLSHSS